MSLSREVRSRKTDTGELLAEIVELESPKDDGFRLKDIPTETKGVFVGKLVSVDKTGDILVDYQDNPFSGPLPARSTVKISNMDENKDTLLMFEKHDPRLPIIIGIVQDQPFVTHPSKEITLEKTRIKDVVVDGKRIVFDAKKEIILRCGKGSVTIQANGKIVIKGTDLISRSKGMNKIKGTAVRIN